MSKIQRRLTVPCKLRRDDRVELYVYCDGEVSIEVLEDGVSAEVLLTVQDKIKLIQFLVGGDVE